MACNLSFIVKNAEVLKVTGSHVYFKSSSILKTVLWTDCNNKTQGLTGSDV